MSRRVIDPQSRRLFSSKSTSSAVSQSAIEKEAHRVTSPRKFAGVPHGLHWALAGRGVIVKDKVFHNLKPFELQQNGAKTVECLSGIPVYARGNIIGGTSEISKAQFSKLLKQSAVSQSAIEKEAHRVTSPRKFAGVPHGLHWALAGRGVIVKDKVFHNLKPFELQQNGAKTVECLSGIPVYARGNIIGGTSEISKAQFSKLLKQSAVSQSAIEKEAHRVTSPRKFAGVPHGLHWALAGRGVIVKDKVFHNLKPFELQQNGAKTVECLSGIPVYARGNIIGGTSEISKAQFSKLLKQVTSHLSSEPKIFVQDGAIGSSSHCNAKVRIISDSPSAVSSLSDVIWKTSARAISHDPCPLTTYISTSFSGGDNIGLKQQGCNGFVAVDIEHSSLILCGRAYADVNSVKDALRALAAPVLVARGGIPVSARILVLGDSFVLLFASEDTILKCSEIHDKLVSKDPGVVLSSDGVAPFFLVKDFPPIVLEKPNSVVLASSDSSGVLPSLSKLSPGQAAYHFLTGYQDGKFVPTYCEAPSPIPAMQLARALHSHLKKNEIPSFLLNVSAGRKHIEGKDFMTVIESAASRRIPEGSFGLSHDPKDLKGKFNTFLSFKFQDLPKEFSF